MQGIEDGSSTKLSGSSLDLWSASFGEVDAILASIHNVDSAKRTAFQARLKHFLKLGALENVQKGRGRAASYSAGDVITLTMLCDLSNMGLSPERSTALVQREKFCLASATSKSFHLLREVDSFSRGENLNEQVVAYFVPNYFSVFSRSDVYYDNILLWSYYEQFIRKHIKTSAHKQLRQFSFINYTSLLRELVINIECRDDFLLGVSAWIDAERKSAEEQKVNSLWGDW